VVRMRQLLKSDVPTLNKTVAYSAFVKAERAVFREGTERP